MRYSALVKLTLFFLLLFGIASFLSCAYSESLQGKVVGVHDGDTITLLDNNDTQYRIRLAGIDAPELSQPFGKASKDHLSTLIFGKTVSVEYSKRDKYGRIVGKIVLDKQDICLEQIRSGLAWHYKKYENEQSPEDRVTYAAAEEKARSQKTGLWQDPNPVPPWDYRKNRKYHRTQEKSQ